MSNATESGRADLERKSEALKSGKRKLKAALLKLRRALPMEGGKFTPNLKAVDGVFFAR